MANPQVQNDPIYSLPFLYRYGLNISNDITTPNTVLDIGPGQCRDSNDIIDIPVGVNNPNLEGSTVATPLLINAAINGAGGLDTGTLAASTNYAVYVIADSRYIQPTAGMISLGSNALPLLPYGYDSYRLIGAWSTDSSSHFIRGYFSGTGSTLVFTYDAPQATAVTAGNAVAYTAVSLAGLVPALQNIPVMLQTNFNANAAGDTLKLQGFSSTGDAVTIIAPVAGSVAHTVSVSTVIAQLNGSAPSINYKVSSASDAVAINVVGYVLYL